MKSEELRQRRYIMEREIHEAATMAIKSFEAATGFSPESITFHMGHSDRIGQNHPSRVHIIRVEAAVRV